MAGYFNSLLAGHERAAALAGQASGAPGEFLIEVVGANRYRTRSLPPPSLLPTMPPSPPHALVCVDFDGTVIDPSFDPPFPDTLAETLARLQSRGVPWAIATGRSLFQVVEGIANHRVRPLPDFIISSERELFRRSGLSRWAPVGDWNERCARDHRKLFRRNARFFRRMRSYVEASTTGRYVENSSEPAAIVAASDAEMDVICRFIESQIPELPSLGYERNSVYLRFSHSSYSKGSTLAELARYLGLGRERVFAAGDNHNDLSMLDGTAAKLVACPANAIDEVKNVVANLGGFVANVPAGEGTAEALRHYFGDACR